MKKLCKANSIEAWRAKAESYRGKKVHAINFDGTFGRVYQISTDANFYQTALNEIHNGTFYIYRRGVWSR